MSVEPGNASFYRWESDVEEGDSGTPVSLLASAGRDGRLLLLDAVVEEEVLVEFPFGAEWRNRTGCNRFVRLRRPVDGAVYALVRSGA